jgi:serine/threonine protein kinase
MGARDDESERGHESNPVSTLAGVSSDFEDSLLKRVADSGDQESQEQGVPAIGSVLDGKYQLEGLLGRGGMGFVFAARHLTTGRQVAIKWMLRKGDLDQQRKRFVREARAAGRIRHPNVIDIYDVVSDEHSTYLVIELLEGESLRARLRRERLEPQKAVEIAVSVLEGLREAHRQGVIHRDLKPENVFLCASPPSTKVLDFGISVLSESRPAADTNLTKTGYFVGTPIYTPLERLRENQPFDHRVDLYSVGVILYEMLTGALPFSGRTPSELAYQLAVTAPERPRALRPDLAPTLEAVVIKALARNAGERFRDAQEFIDALNTALESPRGIGAVLRRAARFAIVPLIAALAIGLAIGARPAEPARALKQGNPVSWFGEGAFTPSEPSRNVTPALSTPMPPGPVKADKSRAAGGRALRPTGSASLPPVASAQTAAQRASGTAEVTVIVFPYGDVWIDGRRVGSSPSTSKVPAGTHRIAGGRIAPEKETTVNLAPDESRQVLLSWKAPKGENQTPAAVPASSAE